MEKLEINIAGIKETITLKNKEEIDLYNEVICELNTECNNLCIKFGNIDRTILLFYILFKNQSALLKLTNDNLIDNVLSNICKYIEEKNNNKITFEDKITKIRKNLVVINVINRVKIKSGVNSNESKEDDEFLQMINKFTNDIKNDIDIVKNELLLL